MMHRPALSRRGTAFEQGARVVVLRLGEDAIDGAGFDDLAPIHHVHPLDHAGDDAEIVGDQHQRHAAFLATAACSSRRICACTVTSSAVVGSSAISRSGSQEIAIAISTRWRMPPENWCG